MSDDLGFGLFIGFVGILLGAFTQQGIDNSDKAELGQAICEEEFGMNYTLENIKSIWKKVKEAK